MKKFFLTSALLIAFVIPMLAQIDHDYNANDRIPLSGTTLSKDQIPAAVLSSFQTQFDKNNPLTWTKFPYALKEYGWVYDVGASNLNLNRYEVTMKTTTGNELWAIYDLKGNLIETREMSTNIAVPQSVMESLAKSPYKDWTITGNKEIIRFYHDRDNSSVEQHFRVTLEKDKQKRSVSFNYQASTNK
jgi:hypothetical protein